MKSPLLLILLAVSASARIAAPAGFEARPSFPPPPCSARTLWVCLTACASGFPPTAKWRISSSTRISARSNCESAGRWNSSTGLSCFSPAASNPGNPPTWRWKSSDACPARWIPPGLLQVAAPVDFLSWTPDVAEFAHRDDLVGRKPVLLPGGGASERTRAELRALGWTLATH